jgi:hypothetical protein
MKILEYNIPATKYSSLKTDEIEKTISQISKLIWKKWKVNVGWLKLNFWWENNEDQVEIRILWNFSKQKEEYMNEIMDNLLNGIENWDISEMNLYDRRINRWEIIEELNNYSFTSVKVREYLSEIKKILNSSSWEPEYFYSKLWLRHCDDWRKFKLPEKVSETDLRICSKFLKKIIKCAQEESLYISDGILNLFQNLNSLLSVGITEWNMRFYSEVVEKMKIIKNYFWQVGKWYFPYDDIDKYHLKSLRNILVLLKMHKKEFNEISPIPENYANWIKNANLLLSSKEKSKSVFIDYDSISELCDYVLNVFLAFDTRS